jgi:hypothetical protein
MEIESAPGEFHRATEEMGSKMTEQDDVARSGRAQRQIKLWACLVAVIYAIYALCTGETGNTVFVLIISALTFLSVTPTGEIVSDLAGPPRLIIKWVRLHSWRELPTYLAGNARNIFRSSDKIVRFLLLAISVGGTAVVVKLGIGNFSLLPPYLDVAVKRLGPALVILVLVLYPAYVISKRIFLLSMNDLDPTCNKYEIRFYVSVFLFCITILALFCGIPVEDKFPSAIGEKHTKLPSYDVEWVWYLSSVSLIWFIWSISFGASIISRFFEIAWRDLPPRSL